MGTLSTDAELAADLSGSAYRFVRKLARGAMGEVIVVEHVDLGERRVMKLLRPHLANLDDLATRLRTEARILTQLDHPNLVRVMDFGRTHAGRPYLVMEELCGRTLKDLVKEAGPCSVDEVVRIGAEILLGLERVHAAQVVHRDLKPDNVFLCDAPPGGVAAVKILDFGIVKVLNDEERARLGHVAPTAEGMLVGTPAYLSPEQAVGQAIDARTDIYALGAILTFLLTGEPPFRRGTQLELLRAHIIDPPDPPSSRAPLASKRLVRALDPIVLKALEKKPAARYQSAREMRDALVAAREHAEAALAARYPPHNADVEATVLAGPIPTELESTLVPRQAGRPTVRMMPSPDQRAHERAAEPRKARSVIDRAFDVEPERLPPAQQRLYLIAKLVIALLVLMALSLGLILALRG